MSTWNYDVIIPREAEEIFEFTIGGGESLVLYGAEDFGEILSWINLVDLSLEVVPSCRESLHACLDWFGTNRERVEVSLSILRDARAKINDPLYAALLNPSTEYRMLAERVRDGRSGLRRPYHPTRFLSLSCGNFLSEDTYESKKF